MSRTALLIVLVFAVGCKTAAEIPQIAKEHNDYGVDYLNQGQLDKAQQRFELALEYNEDYPEPYGNLALVWIARNDLDKAKEMAIKAIRLNTDVAEAHNTLGYIYLQNKAYGKAHDRFVDALRINPGYVEARYNLCLAYQSLKRDSEARICFSKVIETNSNFADPFHELCKMDIEDRKAEDAVGHCTRAVELEPQFTEAYFHLGLALQKAGKHCEAQDAYKECIALDDSNAECRNNLASAVRHCGLVDPHLKEIKENTSEESSAASLYELGRAEKEKGLLPEAERRFKACIKKDGRFGPCYCELADLSEKLAREDEAQALCKKCVRFTSDEHMSPEHDACRTKLENP